MYVTLPLRYIDLRSGLVFVVVVFFSILFLSTRVRQVLVQNIIFLASLVKKCIFLGTRYTVRKVTLLALSNTCLRDVL